MFSIPPFTQSTTGCRQYSYPPPNDLRIILTAFLYRSLFYFFLKLLSSGVSSIKGATVAASERIGGANISIPNAYCCRSPVHEIFGPCP